MVITQSFNGAGYPDLTWINRVFWLFEIPLAYAPRRIGNRALGYFPRHHDRVFTLAVVSAWIFKQGKWKVRTV